MSDTKARKLLEQLRKEIEQTGSLDAKGRDLLQGLDADIHDLLERSADAADASVMKRMEDSVDHFQVSHPTLTMILSELMNILNNAGI